MKVMRPVNALMRKMKDNKTEIYKFIKASSSRI